jgi:hypothetical protein
MSAIELPRLGLRRVKTCPARAKTRCPSFPSGKSSVSSPVRVSLSLWDSRFGEGTGLTAARKRDARVVAVVLSVAALTLTGLAPAGTARADTDAYLNKLHDAGINTPGGDAELKEWGWEVCKLFIFGVPPDKVLEQAVYNSGSSPQHGMTVEQANDVVDFAVTDLCDDHK